MVTWFQCRVLIWMYHQLLFTFIDVVLCIVIILMKEGTNEYCEGGTAEGVAVRRMIEEYTQMCQYIRDVGVGRVACLL